jgi:DNA-binding protein HU-beta
VFNTKEINMLLEKGDQMTRVELTNDIAKTLNTTQSKVEDYIPTVLDCIKHGIVKDGKVTIRGFGCFITRDKAKRDGRNPRTGEPAVITARRVVKFKAAKLFKDKVNQGDTGYGRSNS